MLAMVIDATSTYGTELQFDWFAIILGAGGLFLAFMFTVMWFGFFITHDIRSGLVAMVLSWVFAFAGVNAFVGSDVKDATKSTVAYQIVTNTDGSVVYQTHPRQGNGDNIFTIKVKNADGKSEWVKIDTHTASVRYNATNNPKMVLDKYTKKKTGTSVYFVNHIDLNNSQGNFL